MLLEYLLVSFYCFSQNIYIHVLIVYNIWNIIELSAEHINNKVFLMRCSITLQQSHVDVLCIFSA